MYQEHQESLINHKKRGVDCMKEEVKKQGCQMKNKKVEDLVETKPSRVIGQRMVVVVDSGKESTKSLQGGKKKQFPTRVARRSDLNQIDSKEAFVVTFEGEAFVVADEVNIRPELDMSKKTLEHKICIYSAIAKLVPNGSVVDLVIGIPVLLFLDQETRLDYENYMSQPSDQDWIELTINGNHHYFKINRVKALPETSGYVFAHYEHYMNDLVGIIDIGGLNINGCIYNQLNPIHKTCFTINRGGHHLRAEIQQRLIQQLNRDIQDFQMKRILEAPKPSEEPIIREVVDSYMALVLKELRTRNWDISVDGIPVVLTGGTSLIVGKYAQRYFPQVTVSKDPIWDNVKGFNAYAEAFLEG